MAMFQFGAGVQSNPMDAYNEMQNAVKAPRLARLLSDAYGAQDEGQRRSLLQQLVMQDPTMGMNAAKMLDPRMQSADANGMFAQKVGEDGFIYNAMRDGRMVNTGIKADRQMWFRDNPGMSPELVGKDGNVRPVGYGAPQAQPMPQGQQPFDIRYDGPEEDRAVFEQLAAADAAQPFANGNYSATLPDRNVTPQQRAWTQNTPSPYGNGFTPAQAKPAMSAAQATADQRAEQANTRAEEAAARAREAAGRGSIPQGMQLVNGRLERMPGAPVSDASQKPMPVGAMRADLDIEEALGASEQVFSLAAKHLGRMADGSLVVGTPEAMMAKARIFTNTATPNDRNIKELEADKTAIVNASLRLNKGVQTEGDAQRAVQELMGANDHKTMLAAMKRLIEINKRAVGLQQRKREILYSNYGRGQQNGGPQQQVNGQRQAAPASGADPLGIL